jgi:hypothetical protein
MTAFRREGVDLVLRSKDNGAADSTAATISPIA